jgi:hypothetical protein
MLLVLLVLLSQVHAWETDNFYCRYAQLRDVSAELNAEVNRRIEKVLVEGGANLGNDKYSPRTQPIARIIKGSKGPFFKVKGTRRAKPIRLSGCVKTDLLLAMKAALASAWMGNMETWAQGQEFPKCIPEKTVYDGFSVIQAPVLRAVGLNYVVQVGQHRIGVDKLSHFMTEGFDYYKAQRSGQDIKSILNIGKREEQGGLGWRATGIKSYGDMSANYHGYLFWKNIVEGNNPFIACVNGKWQQMRPFNWLDYVNPSFDESINCSQFKSRAMEMIVDENVRKLQTEKGKTPLICPLDVDACASMGQTIGDTNVLSQIIHPRCSQYIGKGNKGKESKSESTN